jgi:XTP/dITP diphosphohydrolase
MATDTRTAGVPRPETILLATRNVGKLRELRALVEAAGLRAESLEEAGLPERADEAALEQYETFAANAKAKALYFLARAGARAVLAEDSGLCVEALGGSPGVRSKRWGASDGLSGHALDAANCERLLGVLVGAPNRRAWYACAAVLCWAGREWTAEGVTWGEILPEPCGAEGFGYDPVFWSTELGACFGALPAAQKATVSHRGRAVGAVLAALRVDFGRSS